MRQSAHSAEYQNHSVHANDTFHIVSLLDYNILFPHKAWSGSWVCGQIYERQVSRFWCNQIDLRGTFVQRIILKKWLIAQRRHPHNLTSCYPVACKYWTLGRCEGLFLSDMAAAVSAYPHQSIELTASQILHIQPRPQLTSSGVIRAEFILSLVCQGWVSFVFTMQTKERQRRSEGSCCLSSSK